jgi:hypothetical protein
MEGGMALILARWAALLSVLASFALIILTGSVVSSSTLGQPQGQVLLKVSGDISAYNVGNEVHFDVALLEHIGTQTIETKTIWTEGTQTFRGTRMSDLLRAVGAETGTIKALAVNNYSIEMPVSDALVNDALLAFERNGRLMSVRDKGPIWIVYPYDDKTMYQSETFYSRSVWQLDRMVITR